MGKCCPVNETFIKDANGKSICVPSNDSSTVLFSPLFSDFNESGVLVPGDEKEKFVAVVGIPCRYRKYVSRDREIYRDRYSRISREPCYELSRCAWPLHKTHRAIACYRVILIDKSPVAYIL